MINRRIINPGRRSVCVCGALVVVPHLPLANAAVSAVDGAASAASTSRQHSTSSAFPSLTQPHAELAAAERSLSLAVSIASHSRHDAGSRLSLRRTNGEMKH